MSQPNDPGNSSSAGTGRIARPVPVSIRRIVFGETADAAIDTELPHVVQVDRAHLIMLAEAGLITRAHAKALLDGLDELRAQAFAPLRGQPAARGLFLLYERHLCDQLGMDTGGILQTGRSRNDLGATTLRLRLRAPFVGLLREALRLQAVLLVRARRFADVVMPAYTHFQAALPITYGHYLAGVATALARDIDAVLEAGDDLNRCPLGGGAVGGTSLPIRPERTAELLGFTEPVFHSIDAVASRHVVLRLLSAASMLGVTLSRIAGDLLTWTTVEFGFLSLPDHLVGSSSMMPQKRNPYLLEHVQGRSAQALGAFVSSATSMHAKPFTNSISVGTEAVAPVWGAVKAVGEAAQILRWMVRGAKPEAEAMRRRAEEGYTAATELANRLVVDAHMPFRSAHHAVGSLINDAIERGGEPLEQAAQRWQAASNLRVAISGLDVVRVAHASSFGGGPGPASIEHCTEVLSSAWTRQRSAVRALARGWREGEERLERAAADVQSQKRRNER
ncbi:argininosuccinate lyase [Pendulispora brunnea]|uniref:Argininosuccinate lyase n=1 Tax=Pendulispora brunnea TaxID=2905690 RepID=A0ABZ2KL12_9BACT